MIKTNKKINSRYVLAKQGNINIMQAPQKTVIVAKVEKVDPKIIAHVNATLEQEAEERKKRFEKMQGIANYFFAGI